MNSRNWNMVAFVIINYLLTEFQLQKEKADSQSKGCPYLILKTFITTIIPSPQWSAGQTRGHQRAFCCWPVATHFPAQLRTLTRLHFETGRVGGEWRGTQFLLPFHSQLWSLHKAFCPIYHKIQLLWASMDTSLYHGRQFRATASSASLGKSSVYWKTECEAEEPQVWFGYVALNRNQKKYRHINQYVDSQVTERLHPLKWDRIYITPCCLRSH